MKRLGTWYVVAPVLAALLVVGGYGLVAGKVSREVGFFFLEEGQHDRAIEWLERARAQDPNDVLTSWLLGVAYGDSGNWPGARDAFRTAVARDPRSADLHYNLAVAFGELGRYEAAVQQYKNAIRLNRGCADAHYNLGLCYVELGRLPDAVNSFRDAVARAPRDAAAQYNLGVTYWQSGQRGLALRQHRVLKTLDEGYAERLLAIVNADEPKEPAKRDLYDASRSLAATRTH